MTYERSVDEASAASRHRIEGGEIVSAWLSFDEIDMCTRCAASRRFLFYFDEAYSLT